MSDNCFKKNELVIPGTRQDERLQKALDPSYVLADERSVADLLVFISKYATLINYYTLTGIDQKQYIIDGNWQPLIMSDEAFNYAGISVTPYALPNITFYKYINLYETGSTTARRNAAYRVLWDVLFTVYRDINAFYSALPVYMSLRSVVQTEISNNLVVDFKLSAGAYLNDVTALPTVNLQSATSSADDEYKFGFADDSIKNGFDRIWIDTAVAPAAKEWNEYLAVLNPNASLAQQFFNTAGLISEQDRIDYSTLQLKQIFKNAFETYARIISIAKQYLENSLEKNSSHFAHHGLLLAFVKLFGILQLDLNEFTRKHLEYYYSVVLQVHPAAAVPDAAHIVFEPAKNVTNHLIRKGTALNAGKDGKGKLLHYNTDEEIVINQAKVEYLKTIFLKPGAVPGSISKVYASPVANSEDGKGSTFTGDDISWKGFGDIRQDEVTGNESNIAELGFYIASPVLHLTEGKRAINFVFSTDNAGIAKAALLTETILKNNFLIYASSEKGWERLTIDNSEVHFSPPVLSDTFFTINLILLTQFVPVTGYNADFFADKLTTIYPTFKFIVIQQTGNEFQAIKDIVLTQVTINVIVEEITGLSLYNEFGAVDPSKPVQIFGPSPKKNSTFYIGHIELEHKKITSLKTTIEWLNVNANLNAYYSYVHTKLTGGSTTYVTESYVPGITGNSSFKIKNEFIRNKEWKVPSVTESTLFTTVPIAMDFAAGTIKPPLQKPTIYNKSLLAYSPATQNGFIRLTLTAPNDAFGHTLWPAVFAQQTIGITKDPDTTHNTLPNAPYTPLMQSIKLGYSASETIGLTAGTYSSEKGQFFHLLPFGISEVNKNALLLPEFELERKENDGTFNKKQLESALYIGISNAVINQTISLLLQINEGTEDISVDTPAVIWNYLSIEGWKNFDKSLLADSTENLLRSGIVKFQVPVDINISATDFPAGYLWIMTVIEPDSLAPIQTASDGLPKLFAVYSNAVKATFVDDGNDPAHLAKALPANTISKLFDSDGAIKKINQPDAGFGGKKTEEGKKFYTRVSERLRHKHRAITIWDHERLVLNEFPEVYMLKCLNHTGYEIDCATSTIKYKENIPGQVMLVPVPFITNLQAGNIYQPTLSAAKLMDIQNFINGSDNKATCNKYIKALHCQLATLKAENPKYETIQVTCKIKVRDCLDKIYYQNKLGHDLQNFLSPWINGDAGKINFGGKLHASQVVYFIEQLSYIDYLADLFITHRDGTTILNTADPAQAMATTSRSVLTSVGNDSNSNPKHTINLL